MYWGCSGKHGVYKNNTLLFCPVRLAVKDASGPFRLTGTGVRIPYGKFFG